MGRYFFTALAVSAIVLSAQAEAPGLSLRGTTNVFADNALFDDELLGGPVRPSATPQPAEVIYEDYAEAPITASTPIANAAHDRYAVQATQVVQQAPSTPRYTKDGRPLLSWSGR